MTSKPASRSARATIFAPRSWPSSPGFAMRMRSREFMSRSEPCRVAVLPEDLAVEVRDLPDRAERLHRGDERRHEVLAVLRRGAHARERRARLGGVPLALHAADPVGLPRLDLGRDAEELGRALLRYLVAVHADD